MTSQPRPQAVPVHDWQKDELARRKANLLQKPSLGLYPGRKSNAGCGAAMAAELIVAPEAEQDIAGSLSMVRGSALRIGRGIFEPSRCLHSKYPPQPGNGRRRP